MANLKDIKRRIKSVAGTQQITRAMKMVAAAKLRRNQDALLKLRPFSDGIATLLARFLPQSIGDEHPLLVKRENIARRLLIVVTGDKGLCGAFNQNILKICDQVVKECTNCPMELITIGRKGHVHFRKSDIPLRAHYEDIYDRLSFITARNIAKKAEDAFIAGDADEVVIVYSHFVSVIEQRVTVLPLLPLKMENIKKAAASGGRAARDIHIPADEEREVYLFEPDIISLCNDLLSRYFAGEVFRAVLENVASEYGARMTAMDAATENAADLIAKLTLDYNRARQASITNEIIEVSSGAKAMEE